MMSTILSPELREQLKLAFDSEQQIGQWLITPNFLLGGVTPEQQLTQINGECMVMELLGQIIYGHVV